MSTVGLNLSALAQRAQKFSAVQRANFGSAVASVSARVAARDPVAALQGSQFVLSHSVPALAALAPFCGTQVRLGNAIIDPAHLLPQHASAQAQAEPRRSASGLRVVAGAKDASIPDMQSLLPAWGKLHAQFMQGNLEYREEVSRVASMMAMAMVRGTEAELAQSMMRDFSGMRINMRTLRMLDMKGAQVFDRVAMMALHYGDPFMLPDEIAHIMEQGRSQRAEVALNLLHWKHAVLSCIAYSSSEVTITEAARKPLMHIRLEERLRYGQVARSLTGNDACLPENVVARFLSERAGPTELGRLSGSDFPAMQAAARAFAERALRSPRRPELEALYGPLLRDTQQLELMMAWLNTGVRGLAPEHPQARARWIEREVALGLSDEWIRRLVDRRLKDVAAQMLVPVFPYMDTPEQFALWKSMDAARPLDELLLFSGAALYTEPLPNELPWNHALRQIILADAPPRARRAQLAQYGLDTEDVDMRKRILRMLIPGLVGGESTLHRDRVREFLEHRHDDSAEVALDVAHLSNVRPEFRAEFGARLVRVRVGKLRQWLEIQDLIKQATPDLWKAEEEDDYADHIPQLMERSAHFLRRELLASAPS